MARHSLGSRNHTLEENAPTSLTFNDISDLYWRRDWKTRGLEPIPDGYRETLAVGDDVIHLSWTHGAFPQGTEHLRGLVRLNDLGYHVTSLEELTEVMSGKPSLESAYRFDEHNRAHRIPAPAVEPEAPEPAAHQHDARVRVDSVEQAVAGSYFAADPARQRDLAPAAFDEVHLSDLFSSRDWSSGTREVDRGIVEVYYDELTRSTIEALLLPSQNGLEDPRPVADVVVVNGAVQSTPTLEEAREALRPIDAAREQLLFHEQQREADLSIEERREAHELLEQFDEPYFSRDVPLTQATVLTEVTAKDFNQMREGQGWRLEGIQPMPSPSDEPDAKATYTAHLHRLGDSTTAPRQSLEVAWRNPNPHSEDGPKPGRMLSTIAINGQEFRVQDHADLINVVRNETERYTRAQASEWGAPEPTLDGQLEALQSSEPPPHPLVPTHQLDGVLRPSSMPTPTASIDAAQGAPRQDVMTAAQASAHLRDVLDGPTPHSDLSETTDLQATEGVDRRYIDDNAWFAEPQDIQQALAPNSWHPDQLDQSSPADAVDAGPEPEL